jgi:hypothetical protein
VGALERIQAGGESRPLDGLFAAHHTETGELAAIDLHSPSGAGAVVRFLTFRLPRARAGRATESVWGDSGSAPAEVARNVGRALQPGGAMLVLLIERPDWRELGDAVARTGGSMLRASGKNSSSGISAPRAYRSASPSLYGTAPSRPLSSSAE